MDFKSNLSWSRTSLEAYIDWRVQHSGDGEVFGYDSRVIIAYGYDNEVRACSAAIFASEYC